MLDAPKGHAHAASVASTFHQDPNNAPKLLQRLCSVQDIADGSSYLRCSVAAEYEWHTGGGHGINNTVSLDSLCGVEGAQTVAAHMVRHIWSSSNLHDHAHLCEGTAQLVL